MEKRFFATIGEELPLLGFGCMRLPRLDPEKQDIDEAAACEMIDYAISKGLVYFDTAYPYHEQMSEPFMGRALKKYPRESFRLATKMPPWSLKEEGDVERIWEDQKRKCQTDYFDFYLMHNFDRENAAIFEKFHVYEFLKKKKEAGEIRHLGFSFHDKPDFLKELTEKYEWDFAQIQLNYLDWELQDAKGQYEVLTSHGIPVIVMEPVRGGALASLTGEPMEILKAHSPDKSLASWAIRYAASLPGVMTVLSGMSDMAQIKDNLAVMEAFQPLDAGEREALEKALAAYRRIGSVLCTNCRYCMDCPAGVEIPKVFAAYNRLKGYGDTAGFRKAYEELGEERQAHRCVDCGQCVKKCPQSIPIPALMKEIAAESENLPK